MEDLNSNRIERIGVKIGRSKFGEKYLTSKNNALTFFIVTLLMTHAFYWATAWYSPWPYLIFTAVGIWFGGGPFKPWKTLFNQALKMPDYDLRLLNYGLPFLALNWAATFSCLYMFGTVLEDGKQIKGAWKHFYFSVVTLSTLGYGNIVPSGAWAEAVVTVESLCGFIGFAFIIGIVTSITLKRLE